MNIDVYVPIRLGSERLPKKALKIINGKPIVKYLIERLEYSSNIRKIVVCTTTSEIDSELVDYLKTENIEYFRGDEHDILCRYNDAAKFFKTDFIVNVEGDDIYTDPTCVDIISKEFLDSDSDYIDIKDMPFGLSPSGIKVSALEKICSIKESGNTETGYKRFFTENNMFKVRHVSLNTKFNFPTNTRLSLDYEEDYQLAIQIFNKIGNNFHKQDLLKLFEKNPDLLKITDGLEQRYQSHFEKNQTDISTRDI